MFIGCLIDEYKMNSEENPNKECESGSSITDRKIIKKILKKFKLSSEPPCREYYPN